MGGGVQLIDDNYEYYFDSKNILNIILLMLTIYKMLDV